jgi:hypothetical protein
MPPAAAVATLQLPLPPWAVAPLACFTMSLAFIIAYPLSRTEPAGEGASWPAIFPSAAINYPPSANVGGLIISLAAVLMSWAFAVRHAENAARLGPRFARPNAAATCVAMVGMVAGPLGVCATPWHEYPTTHFFFAYSVFYLGASYLIAQAWLDHQTSDDGHAVSVPLRRCRLAVVLAGSVAMVTYWLCFGLVGRHDTSLLPAGDSVAGEALLELLCMALLLVFVTSFALSQQRLALVLHAELPAPAEAEMREKGGGSGESASATTPLLGKPGGAGAGYDSMAAA